MAGKVDPRAEDALHWYGEPELAFRSRGADGGPDPRLVELVRILARRAARRWYAEQVEAQRRRDRSGPSST
jgi:hypothetical protein